MRPQAQGGECIHFSASHQRWGIAVYSRDWPLTPIDYESAYPGRATAAVVSVPNITDLFVASLHVTTKPPPLVPRLSRVIDEIEQVAQGRSAIIGGDLNAARLMQAVWPGWGFGQFFDRMDASRYVNCYWEKHKREDQTCFRPNSGYPFQDDHLFITKDLLAPDLLAGLQAWVVNNPTTRKFSDHIPLVVEWNQPS